MEDYNYKEDFDYEEEYEIHLTNGGDLSFADFCDYVAAMNKTLEILAKEFSNNRELEDEEEDYV